MPKLKWSKEEKKLVVLELLKGGKSVGQEVIRKISGSQDHFGDQVGALGWSNSRIGRELLFQDAGKEHRNWQDRYDDQR